MKNKLKETQEEIYAKLAQRFNLENEVADIQPESERKYVKFMEQKGLDGKEVLQSQYEEGAVTLDKDDEIKQDGLNN